MSDITFEVLEYLGWSGGSADAIIRELYEENKRMRALLVANRTCGTGSSGIAINNGGLPPMTPIEKEAFLANAEKATFRDDGSLRCEPKKP